MREFIPYNYIIEISGTNTQNNLNWILVVSFNSWICMDCSDSIEFNGVYFPVVGCFENNTIPLLGSIICISSYTYLPQLCYSEMAILYVYSLFWHPGQSGVVGCCINLRTSHFLHEVDYEITNIFGKQPPFIQVPPWDSTSLYACGVRRSSQPWW
jgi:hypothetical protein